METKYKITVQKLEAFKVQDYNYEGTDGKTYLNVYNVPEGVKYKKVGFDKGNIDYTERGIYEQEVEKLNLVDIIKAINSIK